jgi:hypothetical protein
MTEPTPYSTWRHVKTDSTYTVIGVAYRSTNDATEGERTVIYLSHTYQVLFSRAVGEFMDGRFEPIEAPDYTKYDRA